MKHFTLFCLLLSFFLIQGLISETRADVFAHHLRVTQPDSDLPFDGRFDDGSGALIRFVLSDRADSLMVTISKNGNLIRTLSAVNYAAGDSSILWDGKNEQQTFVGSGDYTYSVYATNSGYVEYTEIFYDQPAIFTRGVTSVTNPNLKKFGFIYTADNGGYATGVARHSADGRLWGNAKGTALLTTTGTPVGPANLRYSSEADNAGYIYVIGRDNRQIFRYHTDSLNVYMIDSSGYAGWFLNGLAIRENAGGKFIAVTTTNGNTSGWTDSKVFGFELGNNMGYFGTKSEMLVSDGSVMFWDAAFGRDNKLYVTFFGRNDSLKTGVAAFNYTGSTLTMSDTLWTATVDSGRANTMVYFKGKTESEDVLYFTNARRRSSDPALQNIYYVKNLTSARTLGVAYVDKQNNMTQFRSDITVDAVGNVIYFENSNEEVVLVAPPTGKNSFTTPGFAPIKVFASEAIADVKIDANNDFIPDRVGQTVTVIGIVNSINFVASSNRFTYTLQDATGGIAITKGSQTGGGPVYNMGDRLMATGTISHFRGTTQMDIADLAADIVLLDSNNPLTPVIIDINEYLNNAEDYESMYIQLNGVAKTASSVAWPAANADANMTIWDGFRSVVLRIDRDTDIDGNPEPVWPVNVKGVATQFTSSTTVYNDGYQISPNYYADFTQNVAVPPSKYFFLASPANNATIVITDSSQTFSAKWTKTIDMNNDPIIYQFVLLKSPVFMSAALSDSVYNFTGKDALGWLAGADTLKTKWTVRAKGSEITIVNSVDTFNITIVNDITVGVNDYSTPLTYYLDQNFPNPFNPSTTIKFGLPQDGFVDLRVYNILGQEVAILLNNEYKQAGHHSAVFNGSNFASGTYIYRLKSGDKTFTSKMILLK